MITPQSPKTDFMTEPELKDHLDLIYKRLAELEQYQRFHAVGTRDWFAGMALQGLLACPHKLKPNSQDVDINESTMAKMAYYLADALIQEREKK